MYECTPYSKLLIHFGLKYCIVEGKRKINVTGRKRGDRGCDSTYRYTLRNDMKGLVIST